MFTLVTKFNDQIMADVPKLSPQVNYVIFSSGPSSEFKNKYTTNVGNGAMAQFRGISATSHGKCFVNGIGGHAKSIIRQKVMSKNDDVNVHRIWPPLWHS